MTEQKYIVFGSPLIAEDEIEEVVVTLRSGWLGTGPKVARFERAFVEYKGAQYALALNSCTAALHLSMLAIGIKSGDEVITTTMTFAATANAIIHAGGKPVLVDCERDSMNIDPQKIEPAITSKTKAIVPVHFAGRPANMDAIMEIASRHNLKVVEDAAHAVETEYHGKKAGTIGDLGCFSFYVTKNVVTGEGGMVTTNNESYANQIKILALHGMTKDAWARFSDEGYKHYQVTCAGFKYNMMDIQAAIGIHQLEKVERYAKRRLEIWHRYNEAFRNLPCWIPVPFEEDTRHGLHLYTILLDIEHLKISRDQFMMLLHRAGIGTGVHYLALHTHPYYQKQFGYKMGDFPNAEFISERTVSLPFSPKLSNHDVERIIRTVREVLLGNSQ